MQWEVSGGPEPQGAYPQPDEDVLGAGRGRADPRATATTRTTRNTTSSSYYRIAVTDYLAFSPDLQVVLNPGGDSKNDPCFAGMLRAEFKF